VQEANYHRLYVALLDRLGDRELLKRVVSTTLWAVRLLLASDRIVRVGAYLHT
jgi:hypothetical protein